MAVPIKVQLFDAFLGASEGIHSIILPDVFSSGGSKNLWIDKYGRAKKILGYSKTNASPVTTNGGASTTLLREMFRYRSSASGVFTRHIIGCFSDGTNEFEIWKSTDDGATWSFVQDLGAGSISSIPDFAQVGNTLIFCDGVVAPRTYDGTTWATAGGTQLPAPTLSGTTSGNLAGTYRWKIVPVETNGDRVIASVVSATTTIQDLRQTVTWTQDAGVAGYEIYRTTATGAVFYFVDYVDGEATLTYEDNTPDLEILENRVLEEHGDAPPSGSYFCEAHKQRMWYLRTDANPRRAYWSDPGDPDSVWTENYIEFGDAETLGDVITGAIGDFESHLVVSTERSIWTISGTGSIIGNITDWSRTKTNTQTGSVSKRSMVRVPAGSKFVDQNGAIQLTKTTSLAYFTPLGDIRLFDGENDLIISHPLKDTVAAFNYTHRTKIFAIHDTARNEVSWVFPSGSNEEPSTAVTWNYRWGVWYPREWAFACGVEIETSADASVLLAGSKSTVTGGYAYTLWDTNAFDGAAIEAIWMTKTLYGVQDTEQPAMSNRKRWRWLDLLFETESSATLTVGWLAGNSPNLSAAIATATIQPGASSILTSDGDTIITATGDTIVLSAASSQVRALLKTSTGDYLHDEGIRIRISDNATNGSWSLEAFSLGYQILPGLQRRLQ